MDFTASSNWAIPPSPITISGSSYICNSSQNYYLRSGSHLTAANSFAFAYIRVRANGQRTEVDTMNPIFVAGSLCLRLYIEDNGYRGAMIITPRVWDGYLGFNVEHTYNYTRSSDPASLYIDATRTLSDPQITIDYSIYYGRYI